MNSHSKETRTSEANLGMAMLLGFVAMAGLQTFSPHLPGNDGYYHLKMALLLPELGYVQDFPWLRWTIFHDQFVSHHHGFHTLLAPFAIISHSLTGDAILGGKLAAAVAMAATFGVLHVTLRYLGARPTPIWLLLLCAGPWHFWLRMSYVRAPMAALPLLVLAVLWCLRGRTLAIGLLAFVFTHIYGGAVLFPLVPFSFLVAELLTCRNAGDRCACPRCGETTAVCHCSVSSAQPTHVCRSPLSVESHEVCHCSVSSAGSVTQPSPKGGTGDRPLPTPSPVRRAFWQCVAACLGVGLGMVLNPYFPANLQFMYTQVFETGLGAPEGVGSEWKTFDGWNLLVQSVPLATVWLWCLTRRLQTGVAANSGEIALLLLNMLFLVLTLKARRFVEYWPVFAMLNAASFCAMSRLGAASFSPLAKGGQSGVGAPGEGPFPSAVTKGGPSRLEPGSESLADSPATASTTASLAEPSDSMPPSAAAPALWPGRLALTVLAVAGAINLLFTHFELNVSHDVPAIRHAMDFIRENSAAGSLILTDDWDSFPTCFYFNHHNTYAVGLDPEFTRTRYPALWERYRKITRGELPARVPSELLQLEMDKNQGAASAPRPAPPSSDDSEPVLSGSTYAQPDASISPSEPVCTDSKIEYQDIAACFHADYVLVADDHRKLYKALLSEPDQFTPIYPPGTTAVSPQAPMTIFAATGD